MVIKLTCVKNQLVLLPILVTPKAAKNEHLAVDPSDTELRVKLTAAPEKGQANKALIAYLSQVLEIPKSAMAIHRGESSRHKVVAIRPVVSLEQLVAKLIQVFQAEPANFEVGSS